MITWIIFLATVFISWLWVFAAESHPSLFRRLTVAALALLLIWHLLGLKFSNLISFF